MGAERRAPRAAALGVFFGLLLAVPGTAQPPPLLEAELAVDPASIFATTKLTPAQQTLLRDRMSDRLARICATHFGFFRWQPAGLAGGAAGRLTVTLRDLPRPSGQDHVLELSGRQGATAVAFPLLGKPVLYQWFDLPKPSDPVVLGDRITEKLEELFANEAFRRELHTRFLRSVPLAQTVEAHDSDRRVIVPLSWDELRPGSGTVLLVKFVAAQKEGEMQLSLIKKRLGQPRPGALQAAIKLFDWAPLTLSTLGSWSSQIPPVLAEANQVRVFMDIYVHDAAPDVDGGLVTSPR